MPLRALIGVVEWWADEGLRDLGRRRFNQALGNALTGDPVPPGTIDATRAVFAARHDPWRLTEITLEDTSDQDLAIVSWADEASAVLRGRPTQQHVVEPSESWGDLCVKAMLKPELLETLVPKPWPATFQLPGHMLEQDMGLLPEFVTLATDYYEIAYNDELAILETWTAMIDSSAAQRVSLTDLAAVDGG